MKNKNNKNDIVIGPVKRKSGIQVITSKYGQRTYKGKTKMHKGVDLRTRRFIDGKGYVPQWGLQKIIAPEYMHVVRFGTDSKGNDFIVFRPYDSGFSEIKYIHITVNDSLKKVGLIIMEGEEIGMSQLKGSSRAHHLHFEVWKNGDHLNPIEYFEKKGIEYKFK